MQHLTDRIIATVRQQILLSPRKQELHVFQKVRLVRQMWVIDVEVGEAAILESSLQKVNGVGDPGRDLVHGPLLGSTLHQHITDYSLYHAGGHLTSAQ